jgi:transcriptional regulator with XRE-family HTH domain
MICTAAVEQADVPSRAPQTDVRTRLAATRVATGLTQKEMAWAIGIPIASYIRLERGQHRNPPFGWLINAATVLDCDLDELIDDAMRKWYPFDRPAPPPPEWRKRPEARERAERWLRHEQERG